MLPTALQVRLLEMKKNYNIYEVTKAISVEVDKDTGTDHVHFDFVAMIIKLEIGEYAVQVYRSETLEVKTISGECSHEEILVRDFFLVDDRLRFNSESEAADYVGKRLDELFG